MPRRARMILPLGRSFSKEVIPPSPFLLFLPHCPCGITVGVVPLARLRALARCLHMWEASLRLRAHNRVDASAEELRNPMKQRLENKKPQIPKYGKVK
jgi:hypothetical protein